jgi:hypothetical protein
MFSLNERNSTMLVATFKRRDLDAGSISRILGDSRIVSKGDVKGLVKELGSFCASPLTLDGTVDVHNGVTGKLLLSVRYADTFQPEKIAQEPFSISSLKGVLSEY